MIQAVIDLGFGDSGKGVTTSFLCKSAEIGTIVVKSNGGHQAGHTVMYNGEKHVFSQFGSGTLQRVSTFISKFCTIYPPSLVKEYSKLSFTGKLYIDPMTMITTPFDIQFNKYCEDKVVRHGSTGMGFGATIERNEKYFNLYFMDIFCSSVLKTKLYNIAELYYHIDDNVDDEIEEFMISCKEIKSFCELTHWEELSNNNLIFESSQGVMLDQHHGMFPNVTRSNTTTKNIFQMVNFIDEIYYVTRAYQTRHGNGFMTNEDKPVPTLKNNEEETNKTNKYQGKFRIATLDTELLKYAIMCDMNYSFYKAGKRNLVITCGDQLDIDYEQIVTDIESVIKFDIVYISESPEVDFRIYKRK